MIYKKYIIETTISNTLIQDVELINSTTYNGFTYNLNSSPNFFNTIRYLDTYGLISDFPSYFYTYEEAFNFLKKSYNFITIDYNIKTIKIVEVYDNIVPPIKVLRKLKLKKISKMF